MMAMWDKKKQMGLIMQRRRNPDGSASEAPMANEVVKDEGGELDGKHLAAQDMMMAFHEKSPEKLNQALSNYIDLHVNAPEEEPEAEEG